jgi:hypothetical protein
MLVIIMVCLTVEFTTHDPGIHLQDRLSEDHNPVHFPERFADGVHYFLLETNMIQMIWMNG